MQLNITFVVQILNFWLTYSFLKRLFFRPLVTHIFRKEKARQTLVEGLKEKERLLIHIQEQKKKDLEEFRDRLKTQYQPVTAQFYDIPSELVQSPDQQNLESLVDTTREILIKEAEHAW